MTPTTAAACRGRCCGCTAAAAGEDRLQLTKCSYSCGSFFLSVRRGKQWLPWIMPYWSSIYINNRQIESLASEWQFMARVAKGSLTSFTWFRRKSGGGELDRPSSSIHSKTLPRARGADACQPVDAPVDVDEDPYDDVTRVEADRCSEVVVDDFAAVAEAVAAVFLSLKTLFNFFFFEASSPNIILNERKRC